MRIRSLIGALLRSTIVLFTVLWTVFALRVAVVGCSQPDERATALQELAFLRTSIEQGAGEQMQTLFPEGYVFMHVLYGLAWTQLLATHPNELAARGTREADWALARLDSTTARAPFPRDARPDYGVFYAAWTLLLRAQLAAANPATLSLAQRDLLTRRTHELADALQDQLEHAESPFLQAYPGRSWPIDNVIAVAAICISDGALGSDHSALVASWRTRVAKLVDPRTGLVPHETAPITGSLLVGTRGSSQALLQRFWPIIDPDGAARSYQRYRDLLVDSALGFAGVREYPEGVLGEGDVDTGPLLFGLSLSSSAVAIAAARAAGDHALAVELTQEADVLGVPWTSEGQRRYLAGRLPIADAFVTWARTVPEAQRVELRVYAPWKWYTLLIWLSASAATWLALKKSAQTPLKTSDKSSA